MPDRLPPLTALRAFEAAARHLSFARAAAELSVTPAALSYQIKSLEAHLGAPLFRRLNRAVELTEAGRALLPHADAGFDALRRGWQAARATQAGRTLTVTAGPAFTARWLAPRMFGFASAHPEIELRVSATLRLLDFDRDEVDVAVRFGAGGDPGLFSEPLAHDWLTPMMRAEVAARLSGPEDLLAETLIGDESLDFLTDPPDWAAWFRAAGVAHGPLRGPRFSQADHALDMAIAGGGVVLGRGSIAAAALGDGTLVAPFDPALTTDAGFRLVCAAGQQDRPAIRAFRDWIRAEMAGDARLAEGRRLVHVGVS